MTRHTDVQHRFETPGHVALVVEIGTGDVTVQTEDTSSTVVEIDGARADEVTVEQRGDKIVVIGPRERAGFFNGRNDLDVTITTPHGADLATKLGSADLDAAGRLGALDVRTGSGDVRLDVVERDATVESGSGDVQIGELLAGLHLKTGSGDVSLGVVQGTATVATGSGDVEIGTAPGSVAVKTGSGDVRLRDAGDRVLLSTASGDVVVDRVQAGEITTRNVSGDIRVGVSAGIPVWTDVTTVTGTVSSSLAGAGQPEEGQPFVELRAQTVSGDIYLQER